MPSYCQGEACVGKRKQAHFGIKGSGKPQWCASCAKQHTGVYLGKRQMCEDCQVKHASYGEVGGKVQWCGLCARVGLRDPPSRRCKSTDAHLAPLRPAE